jgi:membrane fusion protein, macrolide-specific efflux system
MSAEAAPRTAKKKRTRWALIALIVVAVVAVVVAVPMVMGSGKKSAASAPTTAVEPGTLIVRASADGQTEADDTYDVYPEVSGTVERVDVAVGDKVKAGDTLFTLDAASLREAVRQANASLAQSKQQVASANQQLQQAKLQKLQAENNLDKLESLTGTMTASDAQIAEAKRSVTVAKASMSSANASLSSANVSHRNAEASYADARSDLKKATVVAPAAGTVTAVTIAEGGSASTGGGSSGSSAGTSSKASSSAGGASSSAAGSSGSSAPVTISDSSVLITTVQVNEVDIADVKAGQEATVTFDAAAGLAIPGKVRWVSPNSLTTGNVRTYDVEIDLAEQNQRLRPGMTASADIATLKLEDVLLIPKTAVRVDGASKFVTIVKADASQEKRTVTTGRSDDTNVEVRSGLKVGEKILTSYAAPAAAASSGLMPGRPPSGMGGN